MRWVIFYTDSEVAGSSLTDWAAAPAEGVLCVLEIFGKDRHGRTLGGYNSGSDWYGLTESGVDCGASTDEPGEWVEFDLSPEIPASHRKKGVWVSDELFEKVRQEMLERVKVERVS